MKPWLLMVSLLGWTAVAEPLQWTEAGYRIPTRDHAFRFPRDHGSHPEFRIEWWYITGHLRDDADHRFGFQATFFRYAMNPAGAVTSSAFGTNQIYLAHMALSDIGDNRFYHEERLNRDGWDASAGTGDLALKNGNWTLTRKQDDTMELWGTIRSDISFNLTLEPAQPLVIFGEDGLSRKGADPAACSWYLTFPRLRTAGTLQIAGRTLNVTGESWMDHEISSSQLGREQVGWDWLSVRLDDGNEMMVYILRDAAGHPDPHSTLAWVGPDGQIHQVGPGRFKWTPTGSWTSPETGTTYPIDVRLEGTRLDGTPFTYIIKPLMRRQELVGKLADISYWEGACDIYENDRRIGEAYMELTGYDTSLRGKL